MTHTHTWQRFVLGEIDYGTFFDEFARWDARPDAAYRPWYTGWQCVSCGTQGYAA